jgi:SecD/SecF fusion protein
MWWKTRPTPKRHNTTRLVPVTLPPAAAGVMGEGAMRNPGLKLALVAVLVLLAGLMTQPPAEKLRLGKDLRGGVSLVYSVEIQPDENPTEVMAKVIDVLKERVDPNGLFEIAMVAQGRDRLEITMPLPGQNVKDARAVLDAQLAAIDARQLTAREIDAAMRLSGQERERALSELARGDADRLVALTALADTFDNSGEARRLLDETPQEDPRTLALASRAAELEIAYDTARDALANSSPSSERVRSALDRSDRVQSLLDESTNKTVDLPSPRSRALNELRAEYPGEVELIDSAVNAFNAYESVRTTLDDPSDLIRLLRASGVLSFRITVDPQSQDDEAQIRADMRERGPEAIRVRDRSWHKINRPDSWYDNLQGYEAMTADPAGYFAARGYIVEPWAGDLYMLAWDRRGSRLLQDGSWQVASAFEGTDELGRRAINFRMDPRGSVLLGQLTENNIGNPMAVLLDEQVYTAPNLNGRISSQGQITGQFPADEAAYIIRVLNSGTLQSKLSSTPLSQSTVGPELGLDNLRQGLTAGIIALFAVGGFMILYYFRCGVVAVIALLCNAILLVGAMAANSATFSLPGIAGIILTFGMAVDANVLIYERIREELRAGIDLKPAVRLGFSKALSSIVDGNVTNLIICVVLGNLGTQEIKGFAITLGIGVVTTMFCSLIITRLMFAVMIDNGMWKKIVMLPTVIPAIDRALEPKINWLGLRPVVIVVSTIFVGLGLVMVYVQRGEMLDTEFRGGTQVTLQLRTSEAGEPITLTRREVQDRVFAIANEHSAEEPLWNLRSAEVLPIDPQSDGVTSDKFIIKTTVTESNDVVEQLTIAFRNEIDTRPPLKFAAEEISEARNAPVYPLLDINGVLGEDINRPDVRDNVSEFYGGIALVLENLEPVPTLESLRVRLQSMRSQQDYVDIAGREWDVRVLDGSASEVRSAVVLVRDPAALYQDGQQRWEEQVANKEWALVRDALTRTTTLASVQSFSPAIAETFRAQASVAVVLSLLLITVYIWVRFSSVRYSMAAIICLMHDVLVCLGLIAVSEILYKSTTAEPIARALLILPFKIDLNMVAAMLTIIGYSLNDTIVVMDRIRENRGRLPFASADVVNLSINQTISRTVITSGTTLLAILILYIFGGEGVRGFAYAMLIGIGVGTYSSIAIAAPLVWDRRKHGGPTDSSGHGTLAPLGHSPSSSSSNGSGTVV